MRVTEQPLVLVGGGLAAQRCAETLRRSGYEGAIVLVCAEGHRPYDRPPLSKDALASASVDGEDYAFRPAGWYEENDVQLRLGVRATGLDTGRKVLRLSDGEELGYDKLLIATGAAPSRLPLLDRFANVTTLRTLDDARELRAVLARGEDLVIVGAGFIGQEVAAAARAAGVSATVIEAAQAPLEPVLGPALGGWFADMHREEGVDVVLGRTVVAAHGNGRAEEVVLDDGRRLDCAHIVVGVGVRPALDWLQGSGLEPTGVEVDDAGRSAVPDVYAAGDAAATYNPVLRRHVTGGHWEAAGRQGMRAAKAMLGLDPGHTTPSSFWSDLYGTRVQYLGHSHGHDEVRVDGDPARRDFRATFVRAGRPVAALLVGRPHELPATRALLAA